MKWIETITPKQAAEELGVPYHGWMREMDRAWISEDQKYSVMSRLLRTEWGKVEHVTITAAEGVGRSDGSGDIPWAVKMEIKNDLFGEKRVAVEVFPTQDRLVDVCDCYHLWVFEKGFQLPTAALGNFVHEPDGSLCLFIIVHIHDSVPPAPVFRQKDRSAHSHIMQYLAVISQVRNGFNVRHIYQLLSNTVYPIPL